MKLANDCTDCLTAFIKSRATGEWQADNGDAATVNARLPFDAPHRLGGQIDSACNQKFGDYGVEQERQNAISAVDSMLSARKSRLKFFESDLFFDPTWAMLLDLYRSDLIGTKLSVSSLCIGSGVPSTTALRYLQVLEDRGYVERVADQSDRRRIFVRLTGKTRGAMASYIETVFRDAAAAKSRKSY